MFPLDDEAIARVLAWDVPEHRSVSLRHALIHRSPGLWGDHPRWPKSVVLVREGPDREGWHVYGAGIAEPAVAWLARRWHKFSMLVPESWEGAIRRRSSAVARGVIETWIRGGEPIESGPSVVTRRLNQDDAHAFDAATPHWALRGWGTFERLIKSGAAFGVPGKDGRLASVAWIHETDLQRDSIGVETLSVYRRLGLGRAAVRALVTHIETVRRRVPLWTVADENVSSKALARSVGFSPRAREIVLRWTP